MFWPKGKRLAYSSTNLPNLSIIFTSFFAQHFIHDLDYPIPQLQASPSTLWVSTSYVVFMAMNTSKPMLQFTTPLLPLCEMLVSMWDKNNYMCFFQPHSTSFIDESTLILPKMAFAP
jgi:hypothetical protein